MTLYVLSCQADRFERIDISIWRVSVGAIA